MSEVVPETTTSAPDTFLENLASSVDINTEFLDEIVLEHFRGKAKGLVAGEQVRRAVVSGDIPEAQRLAEEACPDIFQDLRLLFKLKQQQFVEELRKGTPESKRDALEFLQKVLTPLAMRSSCEGYTDLKHSLLALVIQHKQGQPQIAAWDPLARDSLASCLGRTVWQEMGHHDSRLSLLLRYLSLTAACCCKAMKPRTTAPITELLVCEETPVATPPIAPEACTLAAKVQEAMSKITPSEHLRMRSTFGLSATQATDSLRLAGGNLEVAVKNELTAMTLSEPLFNTLLTEYAASRGLFRSRQDPTSLGASPPPATGSSATDFSMPPSQQGGSKPVEQLRRDSSRSPPLKAAKHSPQDAAPARRRADGDAEGSPLPKRRPQVAWLAAHFQDLREHCEAGRHQEAIGMLEDLAPHFLEERPSALFEIQAACCQALMADRRHTEALALIHHTLTPLCMAHPPLKHRLKSVTSGFILGSNPATGAQPPALFTVLEKQLREWLGYEEPSLVKVCKVLLAAHKTWFKLQQCRDCFAEILGIPELVRAPCTLEPPPQVVTAAPSSATVDPEGEDMEAEETVVLTEDLITNTMDITNLGRAQVLELLQDFQGDQALLLESFFQ